MIINANDKRVRDKPKTLSSVGASLDRKYFVSSILCVVRFLVTGSFVPYFRIFTRKFDRDILSTFSFAIVDYIDWSRWDER